jgi:hypothetical protein
MLWKKYVIKPADVPDCYVHTTSAKKLLLKLNNVSGTAQVLLVPWGLLNAVERALA